MNSDIALAAEFGRIFCIATNLNNTKSADGVETDLLKVAGNLNHQSKKIYDVDLTEYISDLPGLCFDETFINEMAELNKSRTISKLKVKSMKHRLVVNNCKHNLSVASKSASSSDSYVALINAMLQQTAIDYIIELAENSEEVDPLELKIRMLNCIDGYRKLINSTSNTPIKDLNVINSAMDIATLNIDNFINYAVASLSISTNSENFWKNLFKTIVKIVIYAVALVAGLVVGVVASTISGPLLPIVGGAGAALGVYGGIQLSTIICNQIDTW